MLGPDSLKRESGPIQMIMIIQSIRRIWVKGHIETLCITLFVAVHLVYIHSRSQT